MRFRHIGPVIERSKLHTLGIAETAANGRGRGSSVFPKCPRTNDLWRKVLQYRHFMVVLYLEHFTLVLVPQFRMEVL